MAEADITLKRHDTWPSVVAPLEQLNPKTGEMEPIPSLRAATSITFIMKSIDGKVLVEGVCTVVNETKGEVSYTFAAGDTKTAGTYNVEFEINWGAGKIQSVPNKGYRPLVIDEDLPDL